MNHKTMQRIVNEMITFFFTRMPEVPFTQDDVVVEFFTLKNAMERYVKVCEQYFPRKLDGQDWHQADYFSDMAACALVGEEKVGLFIRSDLRYSEDNPAADFQHTVIHELAHLYCIKKEMPTSEHFIDICLGCTPEIDFPTQEAIQEDGMLSAGYEVWREFIADYISVRLLPAGFEHDFLQQCIVHETNAE